MTNRELPKNEWINYFKLVSISVEDQSIDLEVAGLEIGDQIEAEWIGFNGISYDTKADCIFVHTPVVDHTIVHPQKVMIVEEGDAIVTINIKDEDTTQMVHFHRPVKVEEKLLHPHSHSPEL
jgi:hypothetical protein